MTSLLALPLNIVTTYCATCTSYCACKTLSASCELSITTSRFIYLAFLFISIILAITLQNFGQPIHIDIEYSIFQYKHTLCPYQCMGTEIVYRISIALTTFYILMSLLTSTISTFSTNAQTKYWVLKFTLLTSLITLSPLLPQEFIVSWSILCRYASILFMLIQMCILIDFGYTLNNKLVSYDGILWESCIILISVGLYIAIIIMICTIYSNITYGILVLSGNVLMTAISISPIAPHGTLLTSGIVSFQIAYYYLIGYQASSHINTLLGGFITALSLTFTAYSTSKTNVFHYNSIDNVNELMLLDSKIIQDEESQVALPHKQNDNQIKKNENVVSGFYHITLALSSMYMPMLLIGFDDNNSIHTEIILSQIFGALLYTWTLIAPTLFPNRNFD